MDLCAWRAANEILFGTTWPPVENLILRIVLTMDLIHANASDVDPTILGATVLVHKGE
jgi:hypothetical protein